MAQQNSMAPCRDIRRQTAEAAPCLRGHEFVDFRLPLVIRSKVGD